jgi:hypothetical protein
MPVIWRYALARTIASTVFDHVRGDQEDLIETLQ